MVTTPHDLNQCGIFVLFRSSDKPGLAAHTHTHCVHTDRWTHDSVLCMCILYVITAIFYIYNIIGLIVIEKNNNNKLLNTQMPKLRFCMYKRTQHIDTHTYVRTYIHTYIKEVCMCVFPTYSKSTCTHMYMYVHVYIPVCMYMHIQPSCSSDKPVIQRSGLSMPNTCTVASSY